MDQTAFLALLEETLEVSPGTVSISDSLEGHDWDSLAVLGFISAVDSALGVTLDTDKLNEATTPADLLALVNESAAA